MSKNWEDNFDSEWKYKIRLKEKELREKVR